MASESLSQNEIDALLGGAAAARAPQPVAAPEAPPAETQVYDFRRPNRVNREKLRSLEAIYERFSKSLESWLLGRVRGGVQLQLQSVEHFSFGEFTRSLPTPCAAYTFEVGKGAGQFGVMDFGHEFAYFLVDRLFGGGGVPAIPSRSLTPIERMAVRMIADKVLAVLREAWQDYVDFELQLTGFESIPEILRVANPEEPVLVANVEVTAGETRSLLLVCLPFAVLERFFAGAAEGRPASPSDEESAASRHLTEDSVRAVRTPVAARLPAFDMTMRELLSLAPGRVLETPLAAKVPLEVFVGSQRRFLATPGRLGSSLAVKLTDGILEPPEPDAIPLSRLTTT